MDELQRVLERQVRELAGGVLGQPEGSALDSAAEADVSMRLCGHYEHMFSLDRSHFRREDRIALHEPSLEGR
jgi:hypothetical protein